MSFPKRKIYFYLGVCVYEHIPRCGYVCMSMGAMKDQKS